MSDDRANQYWTPQPIWKDEPAFVLASGPSLTRDVVEKVRGRHTIVVNSSCLLAPWAEVLYFTDSSWYEAHREIVAGWPGLVICMSATAKREFPDKVLRIKGQGDPAFAPSRFPPPGSPVVLQGRSSGHTAVSLAVALGAAPVAMLGFDMREVEGREHCHDDYRDFVRERSGYAEDFVPAFKGWNTASLRAGCQILNCTPGSAVTEFPFAEIDSLL